MMNRTYTSDGHATESSSAKVTPTTSKHTSPSPLDTLTQAAGDSSSALPTSLVQRLGAHLEHDFSQVRVHSGRASVAAADQLGARAYTLGRDIHLGSEALMLAAADRQRLLAHEAIHTAQQGGRTVAPHTGLNVSHPHDQAEYEAHDLANRIESSPSPSLALRDQTLRRVQYHVAPHVQRDLKKEYKSTDGTFKTDLKTEGHAGAKNGMSGTIKFTAADTAPDSTNIRLLQIVRDEDLDTGKDYVWTGGEANRNKMMTAADATTGVQAGYFVDHSAAAASPRTAKADPAVSPYYRDYWPNASSSQDGSKAGKTVKEASLWDYPGSSGKRKFTFETAAKATDTGYIYATLTWGFTISDPAKGTVTAEHASANYAQSSTFNAAVKAFDEFYKNPGASTAPTK